MKPQTILDTQTHPEVFAEGMNERIIAAMNQFAKQEVVNFTNWSISDECNFSLINHNQWSNNDDYSHIVTTDELYDIFKN
jgi:TolB-like protein